MKENIDMVILNSQQGAMKISLVIRSFLIACLLSISSIGFAADHYIRTGATGSNNGSDWTNAWHAFEPVVWTRGDTYYVASGTYSETVSITKPESGETWINILKATTGAHGTDTGWSADYATGQTIIAGQLLINNSYISVDGVTGLGASGHGIKVYSTATSGNVVTLADGGINFVRLYHLEIQGAGYSAATDYRGVKLNTTGGRFSKGIHFRFLYVHEVTTNGYTFGGIVGTSFSDYGLLFEDNYQEKTGGCTDPDQHGQGIQVGYSATQNYWIIRNSVIKDALGSAYIAFLGYGNNDNIYIYNNIFWATNRNTYWASPGVIWAHELASMDNLRIYNNTFYNINSSRVYIQASGSTRELKNNLFHTGYFNYTHAGVTSAYNAYYGCTGGGTYPYGVPVGETGQQNETSDPVILAGTNFSLKAGAKSIKNGVNLSSYFSTDNIGNFRPASNLSWDIGAYQFGEVTPKVINAPQGFRIINP
jgi:hypothetical protein